MSQRPILRSYSEIQAIVRHIETRVHKYLPYYRVTVFNRPKFDSNGGYILAEMDEKAKTLAFWLQYIERAPMDRIWELVGHEIAHPFDAEPDVDDAHGLDWSYTSHALGGDFMAMTDADAANGPRLRYIWRCADCGLEVASAYKTKLPAEFISPCPARRNPVGSSHLNFYVRDEITRRRESIHPLTSHWAPRT